MHIHYHVADTAVVVSELFKTLNKSNIFFIEK